MLMTVEYAEEVAGELLDSYVSANELHLTACRLSKGYDKDKPFENSVRELKCITFQEAAIRYAHMKILANELRSCLEDYRWN